ncbi:helix-turn-helix domain-containing protein [Nocardioides alcanivorans]|uniref:helix-turn-helix domain-containing protein n=1 Tax=Nocardioides alcanivorans TaxID=2897352 RepID=UPI001F38092B|nr:PucR family transcriptional regulator [Nocardioides alcanivorans]
MLIPLEEVLRLPSFRSAGIEVLSGSPDATAIRWVHSSEVYEMGHLLAGGELLLTTGLGLHGRTSAELAAYVRSLADAGCAALAMELGRSFFRIPSEMVEESQRTGMVLLALTSVVPFERFGEDFHEALLHRKLSAARQGAPVLQEFVAEVLAGTGLRALLDAISRSAGCQVEFHDEAGHLVERSQARSGSTRHVTTAPVQAGVRPLGRLVLHAKESPRVRAVADRGAIAIALELGRHRGPGMLRDPAGSLLADLLSGALRSHGEVQRRLEELGWSCSEARPLLPMAVDLDPRVPLAEETSALTSSATEEYGGALVSSAGGDGMLLVRASPGLPRTRRTVSAWHAAAALRLGRTPLVAVSPSVTDPGRLGAALQETRALLRDARSSGVRARLVWPRDLSLQQLLGALPDTRLDRYVADQLGALVEHDRQHATTLVRTLDALLRASGSKQAAAGELGIRRQTLYARVERLESLLGADLTDPTHRTGLAVALAAWRVRTGIDP